jgi:nucleotide-binding universal stress UspA family protein
MSRVLAAVDSSAAARPVLGAAPALAELFGAGVEAIHVREDGTEVPEAEARAQGIDLRILSGQTIPALVEAAALEDVVAVVLGIRGTPGGRRPAGHVALAVITAVPKPLAVVPPETPTPLAIGRALVPLDGSAATTSALTRTIELACAARAEVVALHVRTADSLPLFDDQPQHEARAWAEEFAARYCPPPFDSVELELRVGGVGEHVLDVAAAAHADLIVLGWAQDLSPGHAAVVKQALERSTVPLLLVPRRE